MSVLRLQWLLCLIGVLAAPSSLAAQDWTQPWSDPRDRPPRVDVSASVGLLAPTDWSDLVLLGAISPASGVLQQVLVRDLRVEPDTAVGATVTYWRGRHGFRAHAGLSRSSLSIGDTAFDAEQAAATRDLVNVDTWFYDVRGAIGLVEYAPGRRVWPYVFVGAGGITYDLARPVTPPLLTFIERSPAGREGRGDLVIIDDGGSQVIIAVDELGLETVFAVNFGVGTDFRVPFGPAGIGLRLELSNHVSPSPVGLRIRELSPLGGLASDSTVRFGRVHHLRAAAGLFVQIGR